MTDREPRVRELLAQHRLMKGYASALHPIGAHVIGECRCGWSATELYAAYQIPGDQDADERAEVALRDRHDAHVAEAIEAALLASPLAPTNDGEERLQVQLAGCLTTAEGHTAPEHIATREMYGWSPAYQATLDLRRAFDLLAEGRSPEQVLRVPAARPTRPDPEYERLACIVDELVAEAEREAGLFVNSAILTGVYKRAADERRAIAAVLRGATRPDLTAEDVQAHTQQGASDAEEADGQRDREGGRGHDGRPLEEVRPERAPGGAALDAESEQAGPRGAGNRGAGEAVGDVEAHAHPAHDAGLPPLGNQRLRARSSEGA